MPKYLKTKDGSLESAVLEAVSPAQQAAIAISKKKKAGKPGYDDEGKSLKNDVEYEVPEEIEKEGVADFIGAASKAAAAGKKEFKFGDKTYPVKIKKDVAKKVASKMEETDLEEAGSQGMFLVIQGENDNKQKVVSMHKRKADATKARDAWNDKNKPAKRTHKARVYAVGPFATTNGKPKTFKVGDNVMYSDFAKNIVKEETLAMRTAKHISDMWSEAAKKDEVKSELHDMDKDEKKKDKTMTGKPMSKVDTKVVEKD